jgi:peroxiredoxin
MYLKSSILLLLASAPLAFSQDTDSSTSTNAIEAGHSLHGEAFNEGPRQSAWLMPGTGKVSLKIRTKNRDAQAFFNQGIGQLHGFWYYEAERSFRQAAFLDTNCAMAYWGMAMANVNNSKRAAGFIERARDLKTNASPRERLWIDAYHAYFTRTNSNADTDRRNELVSALENITQKYPKELEAKTFLVFQVWDNESKSITISSRESIDALAREVLAEEPFHPIHHARIHLWNYKKDERALDSAARCGQSAPAIAHMWHMPGHTYSKLKRYDDAAWQQEASARTDHAYMEKARILPDQIHNFAHNNQWLCTDLLYCGRVRDAMALAKNMIELPRHPKYNTLNRKEDNTAYERNNGSSMLGRSRLLDALLGFELWPEMLELADSSYLEPTDLPEEQARRAYALALAHFALGQTNAANSMMTALNICRKQLKQERFDAAEKAEEAAKREKKDTTDAMVKAMKSFNSRLENVDKYRRELAIHWALAAGQTNEAVDLLGEARDLPLTQRARLWQSLDDKTNVVKLAKELAKDSTNQAPELALAVDLLWRAGETNVATKTFKQLRAISSGFDLDTPIFARLASVADRLGWPADWRIQHSKKKDAGNRPNLDSLGPFRWEPYTAPAWTLTDADHRQHSLIDYKGHPVLLVFYLGSGCPHCLRQLNLLAESLKDFQALGITVLAVSSESVAGLAQTAAKSKQEGGFPFLILSDESLRAFKAYRAYDDFERMPLHGTFLIDGDAKARWQDISYEPFTDVKFLLAESKRLLGIPKMNVAAAGSGAMTRPQAH